MSFTEIIFLVFLCSRFHSTSYSSVLLCSFLLHLLTVSHFPDDHCVSTIQQAAGLTVLWTANLQELFCLMSSINELSLEFSIDTTFLSVQLISLRVNTALLSFKSLAFFFPWVCIALHCSLLHTLSLDSLLHNFSLFVLLYHNHLLPWTPLLTFSFVFIPVSQAFLFVLPDDCASDLSACSRRNPASAHGNPCQFYVYYSLQTTNFFLETNIVKREMKPSGTVGRNNTSKWIYIILQCIPYLI